MQQLRHRTQPGIRPGTEVTELDVVQGTGQEVKSYLEPDIRKAPVGGEHGCERLSQLLYRSSM